MFAVHEERARVVIRLAWHDDAMNKHTVISQSAVDVQPLKLLLDYPAAAEALSMSRGALRDLVYKGRGPVVTKIGNRTFFAVKDLERFVEEHRETPLR